MLTERMIKMFTRSVDEIIDSALHRALARMQDTVFNDQEESIKKIKKYEKRVANRNKLKGKKQ